MTHSLQLSSARKLIRAAMRLTHRLRIPDMVAACFRSDDMSIAAAKPRHGARYECAQSEITILARLAESRLALSRSGNIILRMDGHTPQGDALVCS